MICGNRLSVFTVGPKSLVEITCAFAILISALALSNDASAQTIPAPLIAVIDVEGVERNSTAWKGVIAELKTRRSAYEEQIRQLQKPLEEKFKALESERAIISAEAFQQKQKALQNETRQLQQTAQQRLQDLDRARVTARVAIRNAIRSVLIEVMKEKSLNLILNSPKVPSSPDGLAVTDVVLAHSALDISKFVAKRLDTTLSRVDLPATAQ